MGVRYSFLAECLPDARARALAFWAGDDFGKDFSYDLTGTPCANVVRGQACHYGECLQQLFPTDQDLVTLGAQSYRGVPLFDAQRRCIGHLVIMDDKPMVRDPLAQSVLEIFASRAGAELERQQADEELRRLIFSSAQRPRLHSARWMLSVGCSTLDVFSSCAHASLEFGVWSVVAKTRGAVVCDSRSEFSMRRD